MDQAGDQVGEAEPQSVAALQSGKSRVFTALLIGQTICILLLAGFAWLLLYRGSFVVSKSWRYPSPSGRWEAVLAVDTTGNATVADIWKVFILPRGGVVPEHGEVLKARDVHEWQIQWRDEDTLAIHFNRVTVDRFVNFFHHPDPHVVSVVEIILSYNALGYSSSGVAR